MSAPEFEVIQVKHEFSAEEMKEIADEIVEKLLKVEEIEEGKRDFDKTANEKIKGLNLVIGKLSWKYKEGYEMEGRDCEVRRNFEKKIIEWIDDQTGEVLRERPMTKEELQMTLLRNVKVVGGEDG